MYFCSASVAVIRIFGEIVESCRYLIDCVLSECVHFELRSMIIIYFFMLNENYDDLFSLDIMQFLKDGI